MEARRLTQSFIDDFLGFFIDTSNKNMTSLWPMLGYPPLDSWNMILGKTGKLPGALAPEIIEMAKANNPEFYEGNPQDAFPE